MSGATVVCDTGPLIALALIGQLDLLPSLYSRVLVPRAVFDEATAQGEERPGATDILQQAWLKIVDDVLVEPLLGAELGAGEAAVIALAFRSETEWVLLDDKRARRIAVRAYGLRVRGTVGLLVSAKRQGLIDEVGPSLSLLLDGSYFLSDALVERALKEAGEKP